MTSLRAAREVTVDALDWPALIAPGELVAWGQACAEPVTLTRALMAARGSIGRFRAFIGISWSTSVNPAHCDAVEFVSYCGSGRNRLLEDRLEIMPIPYDQLARSLASSSPVVLVAVSPDDNDGWFNLGAGADYLADLLRHARLVIAEASDAAPSTRGGPRIRREQIDFIVRTSTPPPTAPEGREGPVELAVAERAAALVEDGATLQVGLGGIPAAIVRALHDRRHLGVHSGLIGDEVAELARRGVLTNSRKTVDRNVGVTGLLAGSDALLRWAHGNDWLAMRSTSYTHDAAVLRSSDRFTALNSAIEVDLSGQINAEVAGGRYVGAVGGAGAFLRGAHQSRGGLPLVALPSTAGKRSRIVRRLSGPVSTSRADAGVIVTEFGVADLRGLTIGQRRERMISIAHPDHRADLELGPEPAA